jgi:hypothetical protein
VLDVVISLRTVLVGLVFRSDDLALVEAWSVTSARFPVLLATLSDPDFLDVAEQDMSTYGLVGPEMQFRADQFRRCYAESDSVASVLREGSSILRSLSAIKSLNSSALVIADLCDGLTSQLTRTTM